MDTVAAVNAQLRAKNEEPNAIHSILVDQAMTDSLSASRTQRRLKEQLDKAQTKLVSEADPYRVLELIQFSGVRTTVTETGAIEVEATAKLRRALKLYDELNAVVAGTVIAELRDNSTCVGEAKMEA